MKNLKTKLERAYRTDRHFAVASIALMIFMVMAGFGAWMFGNSRAVYREPAPIMVAYVFLRKEAASLHLEELKKEASWLAENFGLKERDWWCETVADCARRWIAAGGEVTRTAKYRGDDIVFAFAKSEKGLDAAVAFVFKCVRLGIPHRLA